MAGSLLETDGVLFAGIQRGLNLHMGLDCNAFRLWICFACFSDSLEPGSCCRFPQTDVGFACVGRVAY